MIDFEKELEDILDSDPLGLLDVKQKTSGVITADERLISSFEEINNFVRDNNREPEASRDIGERKLYSRLKGLRENPEKASSLVAYDSLKLLKEFCGVCEEPGLYTTADVLEHDPLGLLDDDPADDILTLRNVKKNPQMPDHIAKRKKCDEFEKFAPIFQNCQLALKTKSKVTIPFGSERQIQPEAVFVLQGILIYVGTIGKWEKRNYGNVNARLYCVFENGTESNMLLRSLAAALWKDENSRQVVDADQIEMFDDNSKVTGEDTVNGHIYVLRSLCQRSEIKEIENLYKIGFSSQPVRERIRNAANEPTYLMADVKLVLEYDTYNMNTQKFESLIHKFFAKACLNVDIFDNDGNRHTPREWFVVPLHVIETVVKILTNGEIVNYCYDSKTQEILPRNMAKE